MTRAIFLTVTALVLSGCSSIPSQTKNDRGELLVSAAVAEYFEDPTIGEIVVNDESDIRCVRERRVGTHMVLRICRTREEWKDLARDSQKTQQQRMSFGPCGDKRPAPLNVCSEGR